MSAIDYLARRVDVLAFQGAQADRREHLLVQELASEASGGLIAAGIQKLAQRFLLHLLKEAGSLQYLPLDGCELMTEARRGVWRTAADIRQSYASALVDVRRQMRGEETAADPPDEIFADAVLLGVSLGGGNAVLRIQLESLAGEQRPILAALPIVIH